MPVNRSFRQRVIAAEPVIGTFLNLGSPVVAEVCAGAGLDWVLIDLEHGAASDSELVPMLHAVGGSGVAAVVRAEQATRLRIGRALDLGADGVMVPRIESADEAREIASWLRYPPDGVRGVALFTRGLGYGAVSHGDVAGRNEATLGVLQIESRASVAAAAEIASVDGIDVLFIGPTDLTHALGVPGQLDAPEYRDAVESVGRAARDAGKACGVLLWRPEDIDRYADLGFTFFAISSDGALLQTAIRTASSATRSRLSAAEPPQRPAQ